MTPILAHPADRLRIIAEMSRDPRLYRKAAAAFEALGMTAAAEAMIRRAKWYEERMR